MRARVSTRKSTPLGDPRGIPKVFLLRIKSHLFLGCLEGFGARRIKIALTTLRDIANMMANSDAQDCLLPVISDGELLEEMGIGAFNIDVFINEVIKYEHSPSELAALAESAQSLVCGTDFDQSVNTEWDAHSFSGSQFSCTQEFGVDGLNQHQFAPEVQSCQQFLDDPILTAAPLADSLLIQQPQSEFSPPQEISSSTPSFVIHDAVPASPLTLSSLPAALSVSTAVSPEAVTVSTADSTCGQHSPPSRGRKRKGESSYEHMRTLNNQACSKYRKKKQEAAKELELERDHLILRNKALNERLDELNAQVNQIQNFLIRKVYNTF